MNDDDKQKFREVLKDVLSDDRTSLTDFEAVVNALWDKRIRTKGALRDVSEQELEDCGLHALASVIQNRLRGAHPDAGPEEPAMRTYTVRHGGSKHDFVKEANLSWVKLMQLIDKHWVLLGTTEYHVFHQDQPLTEGRWTELLRRIKDTAPLTLRVKTIGKPFSMYTTQDELELGSIAETHLHVKLLDAGSPCVNNQLFPELQVADDFIIEGVPFCQRISALVMQLKGSASAMVGVLGSKAASQRDFISPVLTLSLLLAREKGSHNDRLRLAVDYTLVGKRAWGPVEYVLLYRTLGVMVTEARHYDPSQAWAQVYMQLSSLRDALLRSLTHLTGKADKKRSHYEAHELQHMPTYAVVATATDYRLLVYTPPGLSGNHAALLASSPQLLPLVTPQTGLTAAVRSLVCKLAGIMCRQVEAIKRVMQSVGLPDAPGVLADIRPGEDNDLRQQQLDAARDHEDSENEGEEMD
eukprot:CAMPEP_0202890920 /NCGR_PEP_ID=MMETSP1392-20130828/1166_1 /ASSEMBLY_ACC=CAM_ASM_000868 /TAXON_ID=225041 /ORGANISM="Chlamydomonas chlamydogama, Strain SAG 11-48b" /LENGTH=467 /DNA_ID=CAMNT_0049574573 /DNA_START=67 /DNA_END=1470 /DNA_ORIENTATION=+